MEEEKKWKPSRKYDTIGRYINDLLQDIIDNKTEVQQLSDPYDQLAELRNRVVELEKKVNALEDSSKHGRELYSAYHELLEKAKQMDETVKGTEDT
jgi:GTP1/Obg family GTP-binding protein